MATHPLVTVFMPVHNAEPFVGAAIESILGQTFDDFELLVVDDGSTDRSVEVIERYMDPRVRLIRGENRGCYPARNAALAEARGSYLANQDADDLSLPDRLEKQVRYLEEHEPVVLLGTTTLGCDLTDSVRLPQPTHFRRDTSSSMPHLLETRSVRSSSAFTCATMMFRKSLLERIGSYDERLCFGADVDFVARAATVGKVACLPEALYVFRITPGSISGAGSRIQREILSIVSDAFARTGSDQIREFTEAEITRLGQLAEARGELPSVSERIKWAYYHTRLATLFRVNGFFRESLRHTFKAIALAPENLFKDRKLLGNLVKAGMGGILGWR